MIAGGILLILGAYLLGSVPFGLVMSKAFGGPDPRQGGSGNIGATNVARQAGKAAGVFTLLLDAAKGFVPTVLAAAWLPPVWAAAVALAAFVGHCWPVYLGFKGGKGVATFLGALLGLVPWAALCSALLLILVALIGKHMSLGSITGCSSSVLWMLVFGAPAAYVVLSAVMAALVIYKHKENIVRLRAGQENAWR